MGRAGRPGKTLRRRPGRPRDSLAGRRRAGGPATPRQAAFWPPSMMR